MKKNRITHLCQENITWTLSNLLVIENKSAGILLSQMYYHQVMIARGKLSIT